MDKVRDYLHRYTRGGSPGVEGSCRVRLYMPSGTDTAGADRPLVLCSEPPTGSGYRGPSVTNEVELIACGLIDRIPELAEAVRVWHSTSRNAPLPFHFVEHYPRGATPSRDDGCSLATRQTFDFVTFDSYVPIRRGMAGRTYQVLGEPSWTSATRERIEALTADSFEPISEVAYFGEHEPDTASDPLAGLRGAEAGSGIMAPLPWDPETGDVVLRRVPDFDQGLDLGDHLTYTVQTNVPWSVVHHSPGGFEWSYAGSGPADLALNILNLFIAPSSEGQEPVSCFEGESSKTAAALHQRFKQDFLMNMAWEGGTIPGAQIRAWIEARVVRLSPGGEIVGHVPESQSPR